MQDDQRDEKDPAESVRTRCRKYSLMFYPTQTRGCRAAVTMTAKARQLERKEASSSGESGSRVTLFTYFPAYD